MAGIPAARAVSKVKRVRRKGGGFNHYGYRNGKYGIISEAEYKRRMRLAARRRQKPGSTMLSRLVSKPLQEAQEPPQPEEQLRRACPSQEPRCPRSP